MLLAKLINSPSALAALSAVVAVAAGDHFFPSVRGMASAALLALALSNMTQRHLEENRNAIWQGKDSPYAANLKLASYFVRVFAAIFLVAFLFEACSMTGASHARNALGQFRNAFNLLFLHNGGVLLACFILSLFYGAGGLTLVLAWNALHWSQNLVPVTISGEIDLISKLLVAGALLPHLILEALGYVLGGMAGTFLGKAFVKYSLFSSEFYRVSRACLVIVFLAIVAIFLGAASEVFLAGQARRLF